MAHFTVVGAILLAISVVARIGGGLARRNPSDGSTRLGRNWDERSELQVRVANVMLIVAAAWVVIGVIGVVVTA